MILRPSLPLSIISESPTKGFISSTTFPLLSCSTEPSCCPNAAPRRGPTYHHHCSCSNTFVLGQVASRQCLRTAGPPRAAAAPDLLQSQGARSSPQLSEACTHSTPGPWAAHQLENLTLLLASHSLQREVPELSLSPHSVSPSPRN